MLVGVIIQARMSSSRLPGKVLKKVSGKPILQYMIERVRMSKVIDEIVIATSNRKSDKKIVDFCLHHNVNYITGPLENVAMRFFKVLNNYKFDYFIRLCADSPLIDHYLIDLAIDMSKSNKSDIITNVFPRSFPKGQTVELINSKVYIDSIKKIKSKRDCEHLTSFFYKNKNKYKITNLNNKIDQSEYNLSVDTAEDMARFNSIIVKMNKEHTNYNLDDIISLYPIS